MAEKAEDVELPRIKTAEYMASIAPPPPKTPQAQKDEQGERAAYRGPK